MKKVYLVQKFGTGTNYEINPFYSTKAAAIDAAKRMVSPDLKQGYNYDYGIFEAVAVVRQPVPSAEVVDITS